MPKYSSCLIPGYSLNSKLNYWNLQICGALAASQRFFSEVHICAATNARSSYPISSPSIWWIIDWCGLGYELIFT